VRGQALSATLDVESGLVTDSDIHSGVKLRPREPRRFQGLHRFSAIPNTYNNPGNLLSLKKQLQGLQQVEFGNSSGTALKQGVTNGNRDSTCFQNLYASTKGYIDAHPCCNTIGYLPSACESPKRSSTALYRTFAEFPDRHDALYVRARRRRVADERVRLFYARPSRPGAAA
jgi:hypothetical protein